jgi:hypothetical protein
MLNLDQNLHSDFFVTLPILVRSLAVSNAINRIHVLPLYIKVVKLFIHCKYRLDILTELHDRFV